MIGIKQKAWNERVVYMDNNRERMSEAGSILY